jgi:hypothetical protein
MDPVPDTAQRMTVTAVTFLKSLRPDQRKKATYPLNHDERLNWDYRPKQRKGLPLKAMDSSQKQRALALLASGLSIPGNIIVLNIMSLEKILGRIEGANGHYDRDSELYFVTIFGEPLPNTTWGWRFEGHHLSVNHLISADHRIAITPNFFGANPARIPEGPLKDFRTLVPEEDGARRLLICLDRTQKQAAVIEKVAPPDIITTWSRRIRLDSPVGLASSGMDEAQQRLMLELLGVYVGRMPPDLADLRMNAIEKEGTRYIHFAWAGSQEPYKPHYYRLQGPSFIMEYDNSQNNANHIHSVWRDAKRDWGDDLLKAHYEQSHSPAFLMKNLFYL